MNIHEHQAKELLRQYGIPTPEGIAAFSVREAGEATQQLPGPLFVVKAQIHAGGRGKGKFKEASAGEKGGVRLAKSRAEVQTFAEQMLGSTLVTAQTGADGRVVNRIYVTGRRRHRARAVPLGAGGSRLVARRLCRQRGGRHGHREGGARHA